jgi:hypothetical protein
MQFVSQTIIRSRPPRPLIFSHIVRTLYTLDNLDGLWCFRHSEQKTSSHSGHQTIALIGEGSQKEQNVSSDWFDAAILLISCP